MNKRYYKWYCMGVQTDERLNQYQSLVMNIPGMKESHDELKLCLTKISDLDRHFLMNLDGYTLDKKEQRELLVRQILNLSSKAKANAHNNKDYKSEMEVDFKPSVFTNCKDEDLMAKGAIIRDYTREHLSELQAYGAKEDDYELLVKFLEQYAKVSLQPAYMRKHHKDLYLRMGEAFKQLRVILKDLDILAETVGTTERSFSFLYREARKVGTVRHSRINLLGKIIENGTNKPVNNVTIKLMSTDNDEPVHEMKVNGHAGFRFRSLKSGNYVLTASKIGFVSTEMKLVVISHERKRVVVGMEKEGK